jgi:uncharacterized protein (DUF2062 family)
MSRLRRAVQVLFHVEDSPHRIALSFGLGVFIAFSPLLGLHTLLALGIAFAFRLSKAAIIVGIYVNNPWTIAPMYMAGTLLGCFLLGVSPDDLATITFDAHGWAFYRSLADQLRPYLWPFVVGNSLLGFLFGGLAYLALRRVIERRARGTADRQPAPD